MDFIASERYYNVFEVALWGTIAAGFGWRSFLAAGKRRRLLAIATVAFAAFSVSDYLELDSGAWWEPPWLLAMKAACVATMALTWREWRRCFGQTSATPKPTNASEP